jgi:hypothetical protein
VLFSEKRTVFDTGPMLAMVTGEMKTKQQLDDLDQNRRLDNPPRGPRSSQTRRPYIGDLAVTFPAAAMPINWEGESL